MRIVFAGLLLLLLGCGAPGEEQDGNAAASEPEKAKDVVAAVAANVQFAMEEIELAFESETGLNLEVVLSSSGKLAAQIQQGAPYHLLLSADLKYPRFLFDNGLATSQPRTYAVGTLVLWTTKDLNLDRTTTAILQDPAIQRIAVANPKNAPYGLQTVKALGHFGLLDNLRDRLVYGESIAQVNQYITSGAADIGFTAKSVVLSPAIDTIGRWTEVDSTAYAPIEQGVVVTKKGQEENAQACQQFLDFLFSEKARDILTRYGYRLPAE